MHLHVAKRALRYLKGKSEFGIFYKRGGDERLVPTQTMTMSKDLDDRKNTSECVSSMFKSSSLTFSKKQPVVSLSTTKVEFIAATLCACQAIWLKRVLAKLSWK